MSGSGRGDEKPAAEKRQAAHRLLYVFCLFTKRLHHGRFVWPKINEVGGTVLLTSAATVEWPSTYTKGR
jgi:hypothetical protein